MPEGPEIRLAADRLTRVLAGRTPEQIELLLPGLARHAAQLRGKGILSVQPRSKAMLIHFAGDHSLLAITQQAYRQGTLRCTRVRRDLGRGAAHRDLRRLVGRPPG